MLRAAVPLVRVVPTPLCWRLLGGLAAFLIMVVSSAIFSPLIVLLWLVRLIGCPTWLWAWLWVRAFFLPTLSFSLLQHLVRPDVWRRWDVILDGSSTKTGSLLLGMLPLWFDEDLMRRSGIGAVVSLNEGWELRIAVAFDRYFARRHCHLPTRDVIDAPSRTFISEG